MMMAKQETHVSNKDFYRDFVKTVKRDILNYTKILDKHILDRDSVIEGVCNKYKSIKGYYTVNGNFTYSIEYLKQCLSEYNTGKRLTIRPVAKVSEVLGKYIDNRINRLNAINYKISVYSNDIKDLTNCLVDYTQYREISTLYNEWCMRSCLDGNVTVFATKMGTLGIYNVYKDFKSARCRLCVDHKKSKEYKEYLISIGKIPFKKEDAVKAAANNQEYHGEKWLIYHYDKSYPFIKWHKGKGIKNFDGEPVNSYIYTFVPLRCNNTFTSIFDAVNMVKNDKDYDNLFSYNLGFVNNLHILKNAIPGFMGKFPDTLFKDIN